MPQPPEPLEEELRVVWRNAANTRKNTAHRRVESILESSRAELALRELFIFFTHMIKAFFMLLNAVLHSLSGRNSTPVKTDHHEDPAK
ncbi:MAG: Unknown protein [uncultured Thiotrichaceae bacterium]|uniref:Uncharacterized protein n=1 Tax=uncultured Thiotrichaceae bacterium TaxID=298394 RepID=A0A6S6T281_9GAMM|nr:MAG: Unknown protein [uncultured Thiotrichaceae bacterium]